jgi:hypothetical protein
MFAMLTGIAMPPDRRDTLALIGPRAQLNRAHGIALLRPVLMFILIMTALVVLSPVCGHATDFYEVQIYTVDTVPKDQLMAELHSISVSDEFHNTFEFTYGVTNWLEVGQYLCTATLSGEPGYQYAGARTKAHFGFPQTFDWPVQFGMNVELQYMRRAAVSDPFNIEFMPIAQTHLGRWFIAANFSFERQFSGPGTHAGIGFEPAGEITYLVRPWLEPGVEYYGDIGAVSSPDPWDQEQQFIVPAINLHLPEPLKPLEFNFGVGFGLTRAYPDAAFYHGTIGWQF